MKKAFGFILGILAISLNYNSSSLYKSPFPEISVVHASGSTSTPAPAPTPPPTAAPAPAAKAPGRTLTNQVANSGKRKGIKYKNRKARIGTGSFYSISIPESGNRIRKFKKVKNADLEDILDGNLSGSDIISISINQIDGGGFIANRLEAGTENRIRLDTAEGRKFIELSTVKRITFGKNGLHSLQTVVELNNGKRIAGSIYPKFIFDFFGDGIEKSAYAEQLQSVSINRN